MCHCSSLVLFENLTEGGKKSFRYVWNVKIICTSWGKKKKSWEVIEKEEVKSPANERGNMFSPEFRISMETCVG